MQKALGHGHPVAAFFALGFWRWYGNGAMVADLQPAVRIRRHPCEQGFQASLQRGACAGAPHRPLQSDGQCDLLEFLAVFVLAIIDGVYQFVNEGVEGRVGCAQGWRDEDMVGFILGALLGPALSDGTAAQAAGCEPHGDLDGRYAIAKGGEYILRQFAGGKQQPTFSGLVQHVGRGQGGRAGWWAGGRDHGMAPVGGWTADPNLQVSHPMRHSEKDPRQTKPSRSTSSRGEVDLVT